MKKTIALSIALGLTITGTTSKAVTSQAMEQEQKAQTFAAGANQLKVNLSEKVLAMQGFIKSLSEGKFEEIAATLENANLSSSIATIKNNLGALKGLVTTLRDHFLPLDTIAQVFVNLDLIDKAFNKLQAVASLTENKDLIVANLKKIQQNPVLMAKINKTENSFGKSAEKLNNVDVNVMVSAGQAIGKKIRGEQLELDDTLNILKGIKQGKMLAFETLKIMNKTAYLALTLNSAVVESGGTGMGDETKGALKIVKEASKSLAMQINGFYKKLVAKIAG